MKARQKCPSKIWRAHLSEIGLLLASLKQKPPGWAVARIRLKVCLGIFSNKKRTKINNDNLAYTRHPRRPGRSQLGRESCSALSNSYASFVLSKLPACIHNSIYTHKAWTNSKISYARPATAERNFTWGEGEGVALKNSRRRHEFVGKTKDSLETNICINNGV